MVISEVGCIFGEVACTNDPSAPSGKVCGSCPPGYMDMYIDGTQCVDENGCVLEPCFPGAACTDLRAPAVGRLCGACPPGFEGDGAECTDVDECSADAEPAFGGCFREGNVVTACTNVERSQLAPFGRLCGACPEGYKGSGETRCELISTCAVNNGGCWRGSGEHEGLASTCVDRTGVGAECGECPEGFEGTGETGCLDVDGCAGDPCFPGVRCTDVKAPGTGNLCEYVGPVATVPWACPEGYRGDGVQCILCAVKVQIVDSTVQDGLEKRAGWYKGQHTQVVGQLDGLDHPNCTNQEGSAFAWAGTASDESVLTLTEEGNKAHTLKLGIPKRDLTVGLNYQLALTAYLRGNPVVSSSAALTFFVQSQPLRVVIRGGAAETGSDNELVLSAAESLDPDGDPQPIAFRWACARADGSDVCRQRDGATALPSLLTNETIRFTLEGAFGGLAYNFTLAGRKGQRVSTASTTLRIFSGMPPVVSITPLVDKVNPTDKLTLRGLVSSDDTATMTMEWTSVDLPVMDASTLMSSRVLEDLVIRPNVLAAGGVYRFQLAASDRIGYGSASLSVLVNAAPSGGSIQVDPGEGVELQTRFAILSLGWADEDVPLWYQQSFMVEEGGVDAAVNTWTALVADFGTLPSPFRIFTEMPAAGREEFHNQVRVRVAVMDSLGAVATAETNITVRPAAVTDTAALLRAAEDASRNGNVDASLRFVVGLGGALNEAAAEAEQQPANATHVPRRRRLASSAAEEEEEQQALQQREALLGLVEQAQGSLFTSTGSTVSLAQAVEITVRAPCQLSNETQERALGLTEALVGGTMSDDGEAAMTTGAAESVAEALGSLNEAGLVGRCAPPSHNTTEAAADEQRGAANRTAQCGSVMGDVAAALLRSAVAGEDPQLVTGGGFALATQRCRSDLEDSCLYTAPLAVPSETADGPASSASFPPALASSLASASSAAGGVPAAALRRLLAAAPFSSNCSNCTALLTRETVDARVIALPTSAHFPAAVSNSTSNSTEEGSIAVAEEVEAELQQAEAAAAAGNEFDASGTTQVLLLRQSDGSELTVQDLEEAVVIDVALSTAYQVGAVRAFERESGVPWEGRVECRFWDDAGQTYSSGGCAALPNPAPADAQLYWRSQRVPDHELMDMMWGVGNRALTDGCEEVWGAAIMVYNGTDAGYRKYGNATSWQGAGGSGPVLPAGWEPKGCVLTDVNNTLECWWDWTRQLFEGAGCVIAPVQSCLCGHLTDFLASHQTAIPRAEPPKVKQAGAEQLTSITLRDVLDSVVLLLVAGCLMAGAVYLAVISAWRHNAERQQILEQLVAQRGTGRFGFDEVKGMWTWSIFEEELERGVAQMSQRRRREARKKADAELSMSAFKLFGSGLDPAARDGAGSLKRIARSAMSSGLAGTRERELQHWKNQNFEKLTASLQMISTGVRMPEELSGLRLDPTVEMAACGVGTPVGLPTQEVRMLESLVMAPRSFGELADGLKGVEEGEGEASGSGVVRAEHASCQLSNLAISDAQEFREMVTAQELECEDSEPLDMGWDTAAVKPLLPLSMMLVSSSDSPPGSRPTSAATRRAGSSASPKSGERGADAELLKETRQDTVWRTPAMHAALQRIEREAVRLPVWNPRRWTRIARRLSAGLLAPRSTSAYIIGDSAEQEEGDEQGALGLGLRPASWMSRKGLRGSSGKKASPAGAPRTPRSPNDTSPMHHGLLMTPIASLDASLLAPSVASAFDVEASLSRPCETSVPLQYFSQVNAALFPNSPRRPECRERCLSEEGEVFERVPVMEGLEDAAPGSARSAATQRNAATPATLRDLHAELAPAVTTDSGSASRCQSVGQGNAGGGATQGSHVAGGNLRIEAEIGGYHRVGGGGGKQRRYGSDTQRRSSRVHKEAESLSLIGDDRGASLGLVPHSQHVLDLQLPSAQHDAPAEPELEAVFSRAAQMTASQLGAQAGARVTSQERRDRAKAEKEEAARVREESALEELFSGIAQLGLSRTKVVGEGAVPPGEPEGHAGIAPSQTFPAMHQSPRDGGWRGRAKDDASQRCDSGAETPREAEELTTREAGHEESPEHPALLANVQAGCTQAQLGPREEWLEEQRGAGAPRQDLVDHSSGPTSSGSPSQCVQPAPASGGVSDPYTHTTSTPGPSAGSLASLFLCPDDAHSSEQLDAGDACARGGSSPPASDGQQGTTLSGSTSASRAGEASARGAFAAVTAVEHAAELEQAPPGSEGCSQGDRHPQQKLRQVMDELLPDLLRERREQMWASGPSLASAASTGAALHWIRSHSRRKTENRMLDETLRRVRNNLEVQQRERKSRRARPRSSVVVRMTSLSSGLSRIGSMLAGNPMEAGSSGSTLRKRAGRLKLAREVRERLVVKLRCFGVMHQVLTYAQDLNSTANLCTIMGFSQTALT
ncbi:hypothetical protein CYMTET_28237, partial [Cymbomonas tetramitiformis]